MKKSEVIKANISRIADTMIDRYRIVLESHGSCEYKVYIWEDGEIECLLDAQGGSTYLKPYDWEPRELFYVTTVSQPNYDPWDAADHSAPDDDAEREAEEKELIDTEMDWYRESLDEKLDEIIENAKMDELTDGEE